MQTLSRMTGVTDGQPIAGDAPVPWPAALILAIGCRPGPDWIVGLPLNEHGGLPVTWRGRELDWVIFVGMPFQIRAHVASAPCCRAARRMGDAEGY